MLYENCIQAEGPERETMLFLRQGLWTSAILILTKFLVPQYYTNQGASNIYDQVIYSLRDKGVPVDIVSHKQTITQPCSQGSLLPIS